MSQRYCLVKFVDDDMLHVVETNTLTFKSPNLVQAPCTKMGVYDATPLKFSEDRTFLELLKKYTCQNKQLQGINKQKTSLRSSWRYDEKEIVDAKFKSYIENCQMPPGSEIRIFAKEGPLKRTEGQLRGYISNQIKKQKVKTVSSPKDENDSDSITGLWVTRTRWASPEREEVYRIFEENFENKNLPSTAYCKKVIASNPILEKRTPEMLRAFINNTNRREDWF